MSNRALIEAYEALEAAKRRALLIAETNLAKASVMDRIKLDIQSQDACDQVLLANRRYQTILNAWRSAGMPDDEPARAAGIEAKEIGNG